MNSFDRVQAIAEQRRAREAREPHIAAERALDAMPRRDAIALLKRKLRDLIEQEQAEVHARAVDGARMQ